MSEDKLKDRTIYNKEKMIRQVATRAKRDLRTVRNVYNAIEEEIFDLLSMANEDTDIVLRIFEGITIESSYMPEKEKVNNLTGKKIVASRKIKPKANITRSYGDKLTSTIES